MITKISRSDSIQQKWADEGRISYFDRPEDLKVISAMNARMQEVRREFQVKDSQSQIAASHVVLTD